MRLVWVCGVLGVAGLVACNDAASGSADTVAVAETSTSGDTTVATTNDTTTVADTAVHETANTTTSETTVASETTTASETTVDETTGETTEDLGNGLCPGIEACVTNCTDQPCANACVAAGDSQAEGQAFVTMVKCLKDNACFPTSQTPTDDDVKKYFECQRSKCLDSYIGCWGGADFGTGTCPSVGGCLQKCDPEDYTCARDCYAAATKVNASAFVDLNLCVLSQCYKKGQTNAEFAACANQAQTQQPCSLLYTSCLGGTGAGADGAGGAGGAGAGAFGAAMGMKAHPFFGH